MLYCTAYYVVLGGAYSKVHSPSSSLNFVTKVPYILDMNALFEHYNKSCIQSRICVIMHYYNNNNNKFLLKLVSFDYDIQCVCRCVHVVQMHVKW